ncbi:PREDICTED: sialin-like [Nicrophorus vespilloides]|uniref:Sialin-like n=1 Tax=Nicrophorus vespilloides TaxID=110193 RepID=A0ABM1MJ20_NICVS|nr:PREDICTED: sialin-like [Nicrophorus vespilloides]
MRRRKKCSVISCISPCHTAQLRHVLAVLMLFAVIILYSQRVALNIAIVEMVEQPAKKNKTSSNSCPLPEGEESSVIKDIEGGKIKWDEAEQSYVLLSFYIGYTLVQPPAGFICDKYGAKFILITCVALSSVATLCIPITVILKMSWWVPSLLRIVSGAGQMYFHNYILFIFLLQAILYPAITTLLARWVPPNERATLGAVAYSGNSIGVIVGTTVSGLAISYMSNWSIAFYIWGAAGLLWVPACWIWIYSDPNIDPNITTAELLLISESINKKQKRATPLRAILADPAVWALIIGQTGHNYIIFTLITNLPKYMNNVLNYNTKSNAFASSLPFIAQYISSIISGKIADRMIRKNNLNIELVRKLYTTISGVLPAICVVLAGYSNCERTYALICFSLALFFKGPFYCSLKVNGMDLTTNYAGVLMSLSNGIGSIAGVATPYVIGVIAPNNTLSEWHIVFWVVFGISVGTTIVYDILGKGNRAKWDYTAEELEALDKTKYTKKWYLQKSPEELQIAAEAALKRKQQQEST